MVYEFTKIIPWAPMLWWEVFWIMWYGCGQEGHKCVPLWSLYPQKLNKLVINFCSRVIFLLEISNSSLCFVFWKSTPDLGLSVSLSCTQPLWPCCHGQLDRTTAVISQMKHIWPHLILLPNLCRGERISEILLQCLHDLSDLFSKLFRGQGCLVFDHQWVPPASLVSRAGPDT